MKRGKSQYSVEFLITYGWAILLLGIIVASIYTFGWFNPESILPQDCTFYGQVGCKDFYLTKGSFNLSLVNNFGENLKINGIEIQKDGENCNKSYTSPQIEWKRNNYAIIDMDISSGCNAINDNLVKGDRESIRATVYYFFEETCPACLNKNPFTDTGCKKCVHKSVGDLLVRVN